jgi:hypothetical protein
MRARLRVVGDVFGQEFQRDKTTEQRKSSKTRGAMIRFSCGLNLADLGLGTPVNSEQYCTDTF